MSFPISWVLRGELAIGGAPIKITHAEFLLSEGINSILSLCDESEAPQLEMPDNLRRIRYILPDHRSGRSPTLLELETALELLEHLTKRGPVYLHCRAGIERSPMVGIAWLMKTRHLNKFEALDYMMQAHQSTGVLPQQFGAIAQFEKRFNRNTTHQAHGSGGQPPQATDRSSRTLAGDSAIEKPWSWARIA